LQIDYILKKLKKFLDIKNKLNISDHFKKQLSKEFNYQWKHLLDPKSLKSQEDMYECNEKRIKEFLNLVKIRPFYKKKNFFSGKYCLDAGCGPGRWTCALLKLRAKKVDSFDISEEAINRCKKINHDAYVFNILDLKPNSTYDFVLSWGVIHHNKEPREVFSKLVSQVKNGGMLHIMVYDKKNDPYYEGYRGNITDKRNSWKTLTLDEQLTICKEFTNRKGGNIHGWFDALNPDYNWSFDKEEIKQWFIEEGFTNIHEGDMKFNVNVNGVLKK